MTQPAPPGLTYAEALTTAAALQASSGSDEQNTAVIAALAEQVITARERMTSWALSLIEPLWSRVQVYSGDSVQQFTVDAAGHMASAQTVVAQAAAAVQAQQLTTAGLTVPDSTAADPVDVRRVELDDTGAVVERPATAEVSYSDQRDDVVIDLDVDATTEGMFNRPARTQRYLESKGVDVAQARGEALKRMRRLVGDNLMLAQRLAEAEMIAKASRVNPQITGFRRIIHPELSRTGVCGLCIAAADRVYTVRDLLPIHGRCKCTVAAVTAEFDPADVLNKADLDQLYGAAGGTSGAQLKRTRYQVDEHGELGPVLVPKKAYKPRGGKPAPGPAPSAPGSESKADVARRQLPGLEKSLADLRSRGLSADSPQVKYHVQQIAKFKRELASK